MEKIELKNKIIKVAYKLFAKKGYEKTTIAEIIEEVGTSKGGFYHHFRSKEEIIEKITFSHIEKIKLYHIELLENKKIKFIEKFILPYHKVAEMKKDNVINWSEISNIYNFDGNHILFKKMADAFQEEVKLFYYKLITEGNKSGDCYTKNPKEIASLWGREVLEFHRVARNLLYEEEAKEENFYNLVRFNQDLINHLLNLKNEKIDLVSFGKEYISNLKLTFGKKNN
ncbi:MAG: helix-turn-helix domain-containing protein [Clostridiales bacterium]